MQQKFSRIVSPFSPRRRTIVVASMLAALATSGCEAIDDITGFFDDSEPLYAENQSATQGGFYNPSAPTAPVSTQSGFAPPTPIVTPYPNPAPPAVPGLPPGSGVGMPGLPPLDAAGSSPYTGASLQTAAGDRVFFDPGSARLAAKAHQILIRQGEWLLANKWVTVMLEGHADDAGGTEDNLKIGLKRAKVVKAYLAELGVSHKRMRAVTYGNYRPAALGSDGRARALNRRVVMVVLPQAPVARSGTQ